MWRREDKVGEGRVGECGEVENERKGQRGHNQGIGGCGKS